MKPRVSGETKRLWILQCLGNLWEFGESMGIGYYKGGNYVRLENLWVFEETMGVQGSCGHMRKLGCFGKLWAFGETICV